MRTLAAMQWSYSQKRLGHGVIMNLAGAIERVAKVPVADPNCEDICAPCAEGYLYNEEKRGVFVYNIVYSSDKRVKAGKFKKY